MSIAALIRSMAAAGAPAEAIALAVDAIESAQADIATRRAAVAERVRRHRAARVGNVTVTPCNVTVTLPEPKKVSPVPPKDNIKPPLTPIQTHKHTGQAGERRLAKPIFHRLPADWVPGPLPASLAIYENDWPPGFIDAQAERFRDWAANAADADGKGRKIKWDQAFHNWLRDRKNDRVPSTGHMGGHHGAQPRPLGNVRVQAAATLRAQFGTAAAGH